MTDHIRLLLIFLVLTTSLSHAKFPSTKADFKRLPPYCEARFDKEGGHNQSKWKKLFGEAFLHIHHYCAGLHIMNATLDEPSNRGLKAAVSEFDYVLARVRPGFVLLPEIYLKKGQVLVRLKQHVEAIHNFQEAIRNKKKYPAAYRSLSDAYVELGRTGKALEIVNEGLKLSPNSASLKRRRLNLEKVLQASSELIP